MHRDEVFWLRPQLPFELKCTERPRNHDINEIESRKKLTFLPVLVQHHDDEK